MKVPQTSVRGSVSSEDNGVVDRHGNFGSGKGDGAAGIAQLTHGYEGGRGEGRDNVNMACSGREHG